MRVMSLPRSSQQIGTVAITVLRYILRVLEQSVGAHSLVPRGARPNHSQQPVLPSLPPLLLWPKEKMDLEGLEVERRLDGHEV